MTVLAVPAGVPAAAATGDAVLVDELVALEKSKLDTWYGEASTADYVADVAADATYFDPWAPRKMVGAEVVEYLRGFEGKVPHHAYQITDPAVDLRGDVAIFTFHINLTDPETGEVQPRWNVTKVLVHAGDGWEEVHIHFGLPAPPEDR